MARYFIVEPTPLRMRPGLFKLGQDFGNGPEDGQFFQTDAQSDLYHQQKRLILARYPQRLTWVNEPDVESRLQLVGRWMVEQAGSDGARQESSVTRAFQGLGVTRDAWGALSCAIQEDFAVVELKEDGTDRLVLLSVCFPSGWEPDHLLGKSFRHVHAPVVEFDEVAEKSQQLVRAMVERGPYVRFVWTVTADGRLDHHPSVAARDAWTAESTGYLRQERQITVPFPQFRMSLFLIRTYLCPFDQLSSDERRTLLSAVKQLSPGIAGYKGLRDGWDVILDKLTD